MSSEKVIGVVFVFVVTLVIVSILTAWPVMALWNWLIPELFGLALIDFWQALGIAVLCQLLFKSTASSK